MASTSGSNSSQRGNAGTRGSGGQQQPGNSGLNESISSMDRMITICNNLKPLVSVAPRVVSASSSSAPAAEVEVVTANAPRSGISETGINLNMPIPEPAYRAIGTLMNDKKELTEELQRCKTQNTKYQVDLQLAAVEIMGLKQKITQLERTQLNNLKLQLQRLVAKLKTVETRLEEATKENQLVKEKLIAEQDKADTMQDMLRNTCQSVIDLRLRFGRLLKSQMAETDQGMNLERKMNELVRQLENWESQEDFDLYAFHNKIEGEMKTMNFIVDNYIQLTSKRSPSAEAVGQTNTEPFEGSSTAVSQLEGSSSTMETLKTEEEMGDTEDEEEEDTEAEVYELSEQKIQVMEVATTSTNTSVVASSPPPRDASPSPIPSEDLNMDATRTILRRPHEVDESRQQEGFYCICNLLFRTKEHLNHHVKYFSLEKRFMCHFEECGRSFVGASYLRKHVQKKHKVRMDTTFGCTDCGECFPTRLEFSKHRRQFHSLRQVMQVQQQEESEVEEQQQVVQNEPPPPPASEEMEVNASNDEEENEAEPIALADTTPPYDGPSMDDDVNHDDFADELIAASFNTSGRLHAVDETKRHLGAYCVCGQLCANRNALHHHLWYRNYQNKLTCHICNRSYPGQSYLNKHMYGAHKLFPVQQSMATESQAREMENAMATSENQEGFQPTPVEHAEDPTIMDGHFHCKCGIKFRSDQALSTHIQYFTGFPKFRCKMCGKGFVAIQYLRKHMMRTHKIFLKTTSKGCFECGEVFDSLLEYRQHYKTIHQKGQIPVPQKTLRRLSGEKDEHGVVDFVDLEPVAGSSTMLAAGTLYHCKCGRTFSMEKSLVLHIQSQSNGKVFRCEWCPRRFINHGGLKKHIVKFHKTVVYKKRFGCRQCGQTFVTQAQLFYHSRILHQQPNSTVRAQGQATATVTSTAVGSAQGTQPVGNNGAENQQMVADDEVVIED